MINMIDSEDISGKIAKGLLKDILQVKLKLTLY